MELTAAAVMVLRTLSEKGDLDAAGIAERCALSIETVSGTLAELLRRRLAVAGASGRMAITEAGINELYLYNTI